MIAPISIADCRHGRFMYLARDGYIGRSLEIYGEFSEAEVTLWQQYVRPGDLVIDAGANIGAHTVALARLVGERGIVLAFEPIRFLSQLCAGNVALNGLTNVAIYQVALGAEAGSVLVPAIDYTAADNFGGVPLGHWSDGERVLVERLDDMAIPRCALMKIDVEGMELDVLNGAQQLIAKYRPLLYVEEGERNGAALHRSLQGMRYRIYRHVPPLFNPLNYRGHSDDIYAGMFDGQIHNLLCVPIERAQPTPGLPEITVGPIDQA